MEQSKTPTKKCKACQKEIDPKAKICPYCRTKQTSTAVNVIAGIITIIVIIWIIGAIASGSKSSSVNNTPALSSNGSSSVATTQQSNSPTPNSPTHDDLMKQNNPDIKHLITLTADYVGKSFVLYANAEVQNYYNYGFNDENAYYSLKLWDNSVNGDYDGTYGYIDRTNPNSKALVEKILNGSTFLKINASIPTSKYEQSSNAFLQIDSWEEVK
jgi:RNA polymerase subunit RPABC4/transcription elongation factor Spt4